MNIEQAVALTNMRKQQTALLAEGHSSRTAAEMAEIVFELSAAAGEPYVGAKPRAWAERWLASKKFTLVDIDPRQVAVPFTNKISRTKVLATMQASVDSLPPIVVDVNMQGIGKTNTGYVPILIVVDGTHRHRAQMLCGRDRISAWVGDKALTTLQARATSKKKFVLDKAQNPGRPLSKIEVQAALNSPSGGSPMAVTRQDIGDGGARPVGSPHTPVRTGPARPVTGMRSNAGASAGAGPGGGVSGLNPERAGIFSEMDPSDKYQFQPKDGNPNAQSPGAGVGPRTKPSGGAKNSEMTKKLNAGPVKVDKIVTKKKKKISGSQESKAKN